MFLGPSGCDSVCHSGLTYILMILIQHNTHPMSCLLVWLCSLGWSIPRETVLLGSLPSRFCLSLMLSQPHAAFSPFLSKALEASKYLLYCCPKIAEFSQYSNIYKSLISCIIVHWHSGLVLRFTLYKKTKFSLKKLQMSSKLGCMMNCKKLFQRIVISDPCEKSCMYINVQFDFNVSQFFCLIVI